MKVKLTVLIIKEDKYYTAYCPALNLSSFGTSEKDAKMGFEEATAIFFEDVTQRGTLEKALLDLGWTLKKLPTAKYTPPSLQIPTGARRKSKKIQELVSIPV